MNYVTKYHCVPIVLRYAVMTGCRTPSIQFKSVFSSEMRYYPK